MDLLNNLVFSIGRKLKLNSEKKKKLISNFQLLYGKDNFYFLQIV